MEKNSHIVVLNKKIGETPLECLERFRAEQIAAGQSDFSTVPMTYAGRLDPMASGKLLVLIGEECKNKDKYLGLDKEYEVEVLFGIETDTQDALGLITNVDVAVNSGVDAIPNISKMVDLKKYISKFNQPYPAYSSKTVDGKQLHTHAREGTLPDPDEMPSREVEIYSIQEIMNASRTMKGLEIANESIAQISKVTGDFRQEAIIESWNAFAKNYADVQFKVIKMVVFCGGGTYMRSLAERMGKDLGTGAIALLINRTKIGEY